MGKLPKKSPIATSFFTFFPMNTAGLGRETRSRRKAHWCGCKSQPVPAAGTVTGAGRFLQPHQRFVRRLRVSRSRAALFAAKNLKNRVAIHPYFDNLPVRFSGSGCSSVGRAPPCQGDCREFESLHPLHSFQFP